MRFPEFTEEWRKYDLSDCSFFRSERINTSELDIENYISTENMLQNFQGISIANSIPDNINVTSFKEGDILISNIRPYLKKVWQADRNGGCSADVFVLKANNTICSDCFLHYLIANDTFINFVMSGAKGVKMPRGDKKQMVTYNMGIPHIKEQNKISRLLDLLNKRIVTQNKIIEDLKKLKVAITQKISKDKSNKKVMLTELLTERCEKNNDLYPVHSVSVSEGIINQIDYLGRSFAANDISNYNVVYYGDIVYTKSPTGDFPYGIVKMNSINAKVSVSPLYGVYHPSSEYVGIYLHNYFSNSLNAKNYLHKLIQKGAKNTINITNKRFLENEISLPNEVLLKEYSLFISTFDLKIKSEQKALLLLQKQKEYLLQQMFI